MGIICIFLFTALKVLGLICSVKFLLLDQGNLFLGYKKIVE